MVEMEIPAEMKDEVEKYHHELVEKSWKTTTV